MIFHKNSRRYPTNLRCVLEDMLSVLQKPRGLRQKCFPQFLPNSEKLVENVLSFAPDSFPQCGKCLMCCQAVFPQSCGKIFPLWEKQSADHPERKQKQAKHPGGRFACLFGIGHAVFYCRLNQLDDRHFSGITAAGSDLHNLGIAALTVSILRCNFVKELLSDALLGYICHNLAL